jgi:hypothetical protein
MPARPNLPRADAVNAEEVLLLWRALLHFRSGKRPGCAPHGSPLHSDCPLAARCPRWSAPGPDDWELSLEEDAETTERRRAAWPCSRLLGLLGPETRWIGR